MPTLDPTVPSAPASANPPPGWYPDPSTEGTGQRWWTGESWSGYSRPGVGVVPVPPGVTASGAPPLNSSARLSLLVGVLALLIAVISLFAGGHVWVSSIGVLAVVLGVRALRLRDRGTATALVSAVVGTTAGALATAVMLGLLLVPSSQSTAFHSSGGAIGAVPQVTPPASAEPPAVLPDDALSKYTAVKVRSITSATAKCAVLRAEQVPFALGEYPGPGAKAAQDNADLQLSAMRDVLVSGPQVKKPLVWPTSLDVDPETNVVFIPEPVCQPLGVLPKGDELHFAVSPDKGQIALAIWNPTYGTGRLWRSVDDTDYPL